jgi:lipid A 3-O-deacylase
MPRDIAGVGIAVHIRGFAAAVFVLAVSVARAAWADSDSPDLIGLGGGAYDVLHQRPEPQLRLEYRPGYSLFYLEPLLGAFVTEPGTVYAYGGVRADLIIADHYVIMPVETVGYWHRGGGKVLGAHVEFKSGAEFAYRFDSDWRLGIAFDHISNAGITRENPGVESLLLVLSVPLRALLR